ncbi:carboxypeptidase-like regulatory domain-containing protein [Aquimarina gracilis]|uniref:Carboxypeptidase-like regulatory domain-containing protein n=1 Tax=Aquimarina gracilis TaxID=874422 RepID=A0ABU5ZU11_9FLAO|nr:carboxypeptidase-like regulatory domain-containing protein [Aquimarina gracilis]MEB3345138.1 carboxypeptidase-like regulatory domain-containing protein [Aquimarina gracilis]
MSNFLKTRITIIFLLVSCTVFSQNEITTISGQILDLETSEPISFASIYIKSASIGTITNEDGYFIFHIPAEQKESIVMISIIGYSSVSKKASSFLKNEKIFLSAKTTTLDEVVITSTKKKELTAKEIVQKAYKAIKNNYPNKPYILEGYIRDLQKEDNKYVEFLECAAKFLYQGYKIKREPSVELLEIKTNYLAEKHPWNKNWERKNSIIDLVEDDLIRFDYGPIKGKNGWRYKLESILPYGNGLVYKITGIDKPFQTSTLFIDTQTFAFVKIELTREAIKNKSWRRRFSNGALQVYYNLVLEYQEYEGKMYLKYQKEEDHWRIFKGLESNKVIFTQYPKKELFINKIIIDNVENYPFKRNMDIGTSIENQAKEFNADFWNSYNIPTQTEKESEIISELKSRTE